MQVPGSSSFDHSQLAYHPLLRSLAPSDPPMHLGRLIEQAVASVFGVEIAELLRPSRGRARIALARQIAMYLAHVVGGLRLVEVGRVFSRDRTTVAHACAVVENRRDDPDFNLTLDLLESIIKRLCSQMFPGSGGLA